MNTVNASTGYSGFQLHLGRSPQIIPPIIPSSLPKELADAGQTATSIINTLTEDVADARDNLLLSKISQMHYASTAQNPNPHFNIGEMVMLSTTNRRHEYKAVLRVPGQEVGEYGSFDHSGDRLALLVGYRDELDVFVLWDTSLHAKFKNGGNIQVRDATVHRAAAFGRADQIRELSSGASELVIACTSRGLAGAICDRLLTTGGLSEGEWPISPI